MISLMYHFICLAVLFCPYEQDGKPEWINNPEKSYPNSQYMTAVGTGDSRKEAENLAASNLSKIFQSQIKSEETINARYQELMKSNQSSLESQTNINKNISVSSEQTLFNVRYPESYTDNLGRVYVLGVIEREPTAMIYKSKMNDNNSRIAVFVKRYRETKDPIKKYADIGAALVTAKVNETLRQQLDIIMPGMSVQPDTANSLERITELCSDAQKGIPFAIDISGAEKDNMTGFIGDMLSGLGFPVAEKGILTIKGSESVERITLNSDQKFVRWSYQFSVLDQSQTVILSISANGREGHITYEEAVARALRTMRDRIKTDFAKKINGYFDALVIK
jgi:LPP20 lipoprotein